MTRIKDLVLALMATAGAVAPPSPRGVKDAETVGAAKERDYFMTPQQALDFGLIDQVVSARGAEPPPNIPEHA